MTIDLKNLRANIQYYDKQYPFLSEAMKKMELKVKNYDELNDLQKRDLNAWLGKEQINPGDLFVVTPHIDGAYNIISQPLIEWYTDYDLSSGFPEVIPEKGTIYNLNPEEYNIPMIQTILLLAYDENQFSKEQIEKFGVDVDDRIYRKPFSSSDIEFYEKDAVSQFDLVHISNADLAHLSIGLIHAIEETTVALNEMEVNDEDRSWYEDDYKNEINSYELLKDAWQKKGIEAPKNGKVFSNYEASDSDLFNPFKKELAGIIKESETSQNEVKNRGRMI